MPQGFHHLKPMLWRFEPDYDLSTRERPLDLKIKYPVIMLWNNNREHRWFGLVLRRVSKDSFERLGICHLSYFDTPGKDKSCGDMINSLPIGNVTII